MGFRTATLLALLLLWPVQATAEPLQIGIIGDQTYAEYLTDAYAVLEKGVDLLNQRSIRAVLHVGDLIESSFSEEACRRDFHTAAGILDRLNVQWFLTPGDHDVNPPVYKQASADRSREKLFHEMLREKVPAVSDKLYYSFDVEGVHFIALYAQENLHTDPRWGNVFLARLSDEQLGWLESDLEANRSAKAVVVFIHKPLWYNWSGWFPVHRILREYPTTAVIAGHLHYDQDDGEIDGIRYITVGACGGAVKRAHPDAGAMHHVTVMTVGEGKADFEMIPIGADRPASFTPRIDMDRIQALEQALDGIENFGRENTLLLKDGQLYSKCNGQDAARIKLTGVGNPIDLPVRLDIDLLTTDAALRSSGFPAGDCLEKRGGLQCTLAPGTGTTLANTGQVVIDRSRPVWETGIEPEPGLKPGDEIGFRVRLWFEGSQGPLFVEAPAEATVFSCE